MTTNGGGWTLIMKNSNRNGWTYANAISLNTTMPFSYASDVISRSTPNYSIIGWADYIKRSESGFEYMIDATNRREYGGIWTAPENYSFIVSYTLRAMKRIPIRIRRESASLYLVLGDDIEGPVYVKQSKNLENWSDLVAFGFGDVPVEIQVGNFPSKTDPALFFAALTERVE